MCARGRAVRGPVWTCQGLWWTSRICGLKRGREDRAKPSRSAPTGSKHHLICDGRGTPLASTLTAADRNDVTGLITLVDQVLLIGRYGKVQTQGAARRPCL
ncbi:MAG TPA: transposase [Solirubrobacteraceae bacterium]|nr:transposase [Solirubrobacteraceae bacterium]